MENLIKLNSQYLSSVRKEMKKSLSEESTRELLLQAMAFVNIANVSLSSKSDIEECIKDLEKTYSNKFITLINYLEYNCLIEFIIYLSKSKRNGLFNSKNKKELIEIMFEYSGNETPIVSFNNGVYELTNKLFSVSENRTLYLPFDASCNHSIAFSDNQLVYSEGQSRTLQSEYITMLFNNIHHSNTDALQYPAYIKDGKLLKFKNGFLAEPWGVKVFSYSDNKDYSRFSVKTNNLQNYFIQHLFQQVEDFAITVLPASYLSSPVQQEETMRQWLIDQGHLKAILTLPIGLAKNLSIASALMVFDLKQQFNEVRFISLTNSEFIEKKNKETQLVNIDKLVNVINGEQHNVAINVNNQIIAQNGYVLDPERYILSAEEQQSLDVLKKYETIALEKLVDVQRPEPISKLKSEGEESLFEIQGGDLPEFGYIDVASKENNVSKQLIESLDSAFLKAGDIVLTIRGTIGKVGIVSQNLLDKYQGRVIVGQTSVVLRMKQTDKMSAIALFMQLRSQFSQARLQLLSGGSVISALSMKDLKAFPVALFSSEKQRNLESIFNKQELTKQEITQKQQQMRQLANDIW